MKRGVIGAIIICVLAFIVIGGIGAGYYAYNIHVYKTVRVCLSTDMDSKFPCENTPQCIELIDTYSNETREFKAAIDNSPDFVREKFEEVLNKGVRCENTCIVRWVRGINKETRNFEYLESCNPGEEEVTLDIRGKEAIAVWKFMKSQEGK